MVLHVARGSFREVSAVEDALGWKAEWKSVQDEQRASIPSRGNGPSKDPVGKCGAALETRKEPPIPGARADFRG